MSRSKRKNSISGITTSRSEKEDKRIYNRRFRHAFDQFLHKNIENEIFPVLREYSNPWSMNKDGKARFDPKKYPELMRK